MLANAGRAATFHNTISYQEAMTLLKQKFKIGKRETIVTAHSMTTSTNWNDESKPQSSASAQDTVVLKSI